LLKVIPEFKIQYKPLVGICDLPISLGFSMWLFLTTCDHIAFYS
jgi:hypothetical protein